MCRLPTFVGSLVQGYEVVAVAEAVAEAVVEGAEEEGACGCKGSELG